MVDRQELQAFHSTVYLAFLHSHNELQGEEEEEEETEAYGLGRLVTCSNLEVLINLNTSSHICRI